MNNTPYIGLRPFERNETELFFGREQHTDELVARLGGQHFLAVIGNSGCGKSSLVKTGLIAGLEAGFLATASSYWRIVELRPGNHPFQALAEKLLDELQPELAAHYTASSLQQRLRQGSLSLHELLAEHPLADNAQLLIVCDQFEELFRYAGQGEGFEAANFVSLLLASSKAYPIKPEHISHSIYVVITMRSDFLGDCAQFAGLAEAINQGLYLTPRLNAQQLRAAIEEPALVCDGEIEPALISQLLDDAETNPDQLPLLQHILMRLWDLAKDHKHITLTDYEQLGGLGNALSNHADEVYRVLSKRQRKLAQLLFCQLTGHDREKRDTRRPLKLSKLVHISQKPYQEVVAVLDVFRQSGRGFLMPPINQTLSENTPDSIIDISHESFIRQWQRLNGWVQAEAENAEKYRRWVDEAYRRKQDEGFQILLQSPELEAAEKWLKDFNPTALWAERYNKPQHRHSGMDCRNPEYRDVNAVDAASKTSHPWQLDSGDPCQNDDPNHKLQTETQELSGANLEQTLAEDEAAHAQRDLDRRGFENLGGLAQLAADELNLLTDYIHLSRTAKDQQVAEKELAHQKKLKQARLINLGAGLGLLIAIGLTTWAMQERQHADSEKHKAEQTEKQRTTELFQAQLTHASLLAKGEDYARAKQILAKTYALDKDIPAAKQHQRNLLASFNNMKGGAAEQVYEGAGYPLYAVAISPDGQLLAAAGEHGALVIFEVATGQLLQRLIGHATTGTAQDNGISSIAFTPNGGQLISAGFDKKIIVWQRGANHQFSQKIAWLAADKVTAIAISPDGLTLASGGDDNNISLWDLATGKLKAPLLKKHTERIAGLSFNATGELLASASYDDTAIIWQLATGKPTRVLQGHTGDVNAGAFSADSKTLLTGSEDKTLRLWSVNTGGSLGVLNGHVNNVFAARFLGNGDYLLSSGFDRSIRLWDRRSGVGLRLLQGHTAGIGSLAIHANQLFSASLDGTVRRWALALPYQQAVDLPSVPRSNAIAPNLATIAVGFADGALSLYSPATGLALWRQALAHKMEIQRLAFNTAGDLLATGSFDNTAKIWRLNAAAQTQLTLQEQTVLTGHSDIIHAVAFAPDGQTLATASYDGTIGLFPLNSKQQPRFIKKAHEGRVASVVFNNSGTQLLSSGIDDGTSKWWDIKALPPTLITELPKADDSVMWSSLSPDQQQVSTVGRELVVTLINTQTHQALALAGHEDTVYKSLFTPDSATLATVSADATVKLWNTGGLGSELFSLRLPTNSGNPTPLWDFDFRCLSTCRLAVPLTAGRLLLYQFSYQDKLDFAHDPAEQKRTALALWQDYLKLTNTLLRQNALQPAQQAYREAEVI